MRERRGLKRSRMTWKVWEPWKGQKRWELRKSQAALAVAQDIGRKAGGACLFR